MEPSFSSMMSIFRSTGLRPIRVSFRGLSSTLVLSSVEGGIPGRQIPLPFADGRWLVKLGTNLDLPTSAFWQLMRSDLAKLSRVSDSCKYLKKSKIYPLQNDAFSTGFHSLKNVTPIKRLTMPILPSLSPSELHITSPQFPSQQFQMSCNLIYHALRCRPDP